VVTHVKAGFFDEPDRWIGISHVLEHMFFKGTPSRGVGQIAKETKAAGGYLNASTTYDHTSYFAVLPADRLHDAVAIQADALMHSLIDGDELARELQVIIQEARRKLDHPGAVTHETLHEVMYDRHRIRRWRIGYEQDLAKFTREDLVGYYRSRYVPARTIVAIVGDVDEEEALALGRSTYAGWASAEGAVDPSPAEPPRREVRVRTLRGDVTQSELAIGWRGVAALDPQAVPLDLAAAVLGSGRGSWLYQSLRESGIATSVSAHHYSPTELGVFSVGADCDADRVETVVDRIAEATARLVLRGPDNDELERARTLLLARWSGGMEEMDGRAAALAGAEALGDYRLLDREFAALASTTAAQVVEAASRCLDPEAVSAVVYHPANRGSELTVDRVARAFAVTALGTATTTHGTPVEAASRAAAKPPGPPGRLGGRLAGPDRYLGGPPPRHVEVQRPGRARRGARQGARRLHEPSHGADGSADRPHRPDGRHRAAAPGAARTGPAEHIAEHKSH
jgi:zinc protease